VQLLKKRLISYTIYLSLVSVVYAFDFFPLPLLGIRNDFDFKDLWFILKDVECVRINGFVSINNPMFPECPEYLYGTSLLVLGDFFHLGPGATQFLGGLITVVLIVAFIEFAISLSDNFRDTFPLGLILVSPPLVLLFERANLDSIILLLCGLAFTQKNPRRLLSFSLLSVCSILKFYTAPLLLFFLYNFETKKFSFRYLAPITILYTIVFLDILGKPNNFRSDGVAISFGFEKWTYWASKVNISLNTVVSFSISLVLIAATIVLVMKSPRADSFQFTENRTSYLASYALFSICFFSGMTYSYRLSFLILTIFLFIKIINIESAVRSVLLTCLALTLWFALGFPSLRFAGDLLITLWVGFLAVPIIRFVYPMRR
jgi:hypothetical protein